MLNINLLVLPLHWKFTSTPAQLGRGNARSLETAREYGSLIALLCPVSGRFLMLTCDPKVPALWVLQSPPRSCIASKSSGPCFSPCHHSAVLASWQGEHTCRCLAGWQRLTLGAGASIKRMHGILVKPGRKDDWRRYCCPTAPHSSVLQRLSLQPELNPWPVPVAVSGLTLPESPSVKE